MVVDRRTRMTMFFIIVLAIWAAMHAYVGWRLASLPLFASGAARAWLVASLAVGFAAYPLGRIAVFQGWYGVGRVLEYGGGVWMGTLMLLLFAFLAVDLVTIFGLLLKPHLPLLRGGAVGVALVLAVVAWIGGFIAPRTVELEVELDLAAERRRLRDGTGVGRVGRMHPGQCRRQLEILAQCPGALDFQPVEFCIHVAVDLGAIGQQDAGLPGCNVTQDVVADIVVEERRREVVRAAALRQLWQEWAAELPEPHWQPILGLIGLGLNGSVLKQNYVRIVAACVFCLPGI